MCSECSRLGHICGYHKRMLDAQRTETLLAQESAGRGCDDGN